MRSSINAHKKNRSVDFHTTNWGQGRRGTDHVQCCAPVCRRFIWIAWARTVWIASLHLAQSLCDIDSPCTEKEREGHHGRAFEPDAVFAWEGAVSLWGSSCHEKVFRPRGEAHNGAAQANMRSTVRTFAGGTPITAHARIARPSLTTRLLSPQLSNKMIRNFNTSWF